METVKSIQDAIDFVEDNILEKLDFFTIAQKAYMSTTHFQRIFSALCGISIGEYIRYRRLTLAGKEILATDSKIIDVACKYGYKTHESFSRAFTRFHNVSPTAARSQREINSFGKISVHSILEGNGNMKTDGFMELHGIELLTQDVERLVNFYLIALNASREDAHGGPNRIEIILNNSRRGANLAISLNTDVPQSGRRAICMEFWVDDVEKEYKRLISSKIEINQPPTTLPWGFKYLGFYDPDGNHISLVSKV